VPEDSTSRPVRVLLTRENAESISKSNTKLNLLFKKCLTGEPIDNKSIVNPSMILLYTVSPFNLWCDLYAPESEKDREPESLKILAKIGNIEEEKYIQETYPEMQPIEVETREQAFFEVLKGCFEGVTAFHSAPLIYLPERMMGIPDVLEKSNAHKSVFGNYHYIVKEKKTTKELQMKHVLQTALNTYILGKVQDYTPSTFIILNRDNEEFSFPFDDYASRLRDSIAAVRNIVGGQIVTPTKGALQDPWKSYGLRRAKEIGDISLVSGIGLQKKELLSRVGIRTISDLKNADISQLNIKGIGPKSLDQWQIHAEAILQDRIITIGIPTLPCCETEIFLDFEGTYDLSNAFLEQLGIKSDEPWVNTIYLIGTLIVENGRKDYVPYFAETIEDEKVNLLRFVSSLRSERDFVVYHWGNYETRIKQMLLKYGIKDDFTHKMINLNQQLKHSAVFPTISFGLKDVAKRLGFSWSEQGMDGFLSIAHYLTYLKNQDEGEKLKIEQYNKEDCEATSLVKSFLDSLAQQFTIERRRDRPRPSANHRT
jgi:predicted RecB family nuclease